MRSNGIIALFNRSPILLGIAALIGVSPVVTTAGSGQLDSVDSVQAVGKAELSGGSGASTDAVTVKASPSPVLPDGSSAGIQSAASSIAEPGTGTGAGQSSAVSSPPATDSLDLLTPTQQRVYRRAALAFTSFCTHWETLLHDREVDNLGHLSWRRDGGLETATYIGYGRVESCECKPSKEGLPIGKIRYLEKDYSIAGKTIDEARRAAPKIIHEISTLEIFSWEKDKWFY